MTEEEQTWRAHVEEVIARLERRAAGGELYAALCLQGWRQELQRITERRHDERHD